MGITLNDFGVTEIEGLEAKVPPVLRILDHSYIHPRFLTTSPWALMLVSSVAGFSGLKPSLLLNVSPESLETRSRERLQQSQPTYVYTTIITHVFFVYSRI